MSHHRGKGLARDWQGYTNHKCHTTEARDRQGTGRATQITNVTPPRQGTGKGLARDWQGYKNVTPPRRCDWQGTVRVTQVSHLRVTRGVLGPRLALVLGGDNSPTGPRRHHEGSPRHQVGVRFHRVQRARARPWDPQHRSGGGQKGVRRGLGGGQEGIYRSSLDA
eukprot:1102488-Prorocentrum_minimum.AAC.1